MQYWCKDYMKLLTRGGRWKVVVVVVVVGHETRSRSLTATIGMDPLLLSWLKLSLKILEILAIYRNFLNF